MEKDYDINPVVDDEFSDDGFRHMSMKDIDLSDRPREKLAEYGAERLSDAELFAILIGSGSTQKNATELMKEILSEKDMHNKKVHDDSMLPKHRMSDLYIMGTNSSVKKIAFNAKTSDGFNPSLCICDEVASWEGDGGLKQYEVMKSGMGARPEGIMLSCTTSGYVNDSIYDEIIKRSTRFLKGDSEEKRLLPFLYMIDDVEKWDDITELYSL